MGWDKHYGYQLYQSDPSGNYGGWKATCIGNNSAVSCLFHCYTISQRTFNYFFLILDLQKWSLILQQPSLVYLIVFIVFTMNVSNSTFFTISVIYLAFSQLGWHLVKPDSNLKYQYFTWSLPDLHHPFFPVRLTGF